MTPARTAEREQFLAERRAVLWARTRDELERLARKYSLPVPWSFAALVDAIASHETGSELTVRWLTEDMGDLPCPGCDGPLPSGAVCACGFDDRPALPLERAVARAAMRAARECDCGGPLGAMHDCPALPGMSGETMMPTEEMAE